MKKAYSYFKSGFVHEVLTKSIPGGNILLFTSVTASQRVREPPHKVLVVCKPSGEVLCGYCNCTAGYSKCCNHVIALLYKIEFANQKGYTDPACTDQACVWNKASRDIQPRKIKDMDIPADKRLNPTRKRHELDPRPASHHEISDKDKRAFFKFCAPAHT